MADPFTIGGAVALGALSTGGALSHNSAIRSAMGSTVRAAAVQQQQLALRAALEKHRNVDQARRVVGALRVAGGESGGVEGSYAALIRQADSDAAVKQAIIGQNFSNNATRVQSASAAELAQLRNQQKNLLLAGAGGAIQGTLLGNAVGGLFAPASAGFGATAGAADAWAPAAGLNSELGFSPGLSVIT